MAVKKILWDVITNPPRRLVFKINHLLGNYREVLWLVGTARSGTTWVSELINYAQNYRAMFEPFHPRLVPALDFLIPQQYCRPHSLDRNIKKIATAIFNGTFTDTRVDARARWCLHTGLLIKDIAANLLCFAMTREFRHIKPVLLIRNPFAVALSKFNTKEWIWFTEPLELLKQKELREDYLGAFEDSIKKTSAQKNYLLNQILIWAILHYVPLRQFSAGDIHICFYEDFYTAPAREIERIMRFATGDQTINTIDLPEKLVKQPTWVSGQKSNVVLGTSPITSWKNELAPDIIKDGCAILDDFGLADLYGDTGIPNRKAVEKLQRKNFLLQPQHTRSTT